MSVILLEGETPPLGLELRVLGLYEDVEVPHQPQEGEDTAAAAADGGVELHDPEVGGELGAPQLDGDVLCFRLVLGVGRRGDRGVRRGGSGGPGTGDRGAVGERDHHHLRPRSSHVPG